MAGKVKKKEDGGVHSKTARASMRTAGAKDSYIASGDVSRIVPLGGGTHAYVLDPRNGRTLRMPVRSERFVEVLGALVEAGYGDRMKRDLADLATRFPSGEWSAAQARLDAAMAPEVPEASEGPAAEPEPEEAIA
ncbi:MAG: hypothetical protein ACRDY7_13450 [Acidimicrobiia bacterium]